MVTRFEKQGKIFQEIERLQAEVDRCPNDSPELLPLLKELNTKLREYNAVPPDSKPCSSFRQAGYEFRIPLWVAAVGLLLTFPMTVSLSRDYPSIMVLEIIALVLYIPWVIWSSSLPKG